MASGSVSIVVSLTNQVTAPAQAVSQSVNKINQQCKALTRSQQLLNKTLAKRASLRGQLLDAAALGTSLMLPVREAIQFESAMANVNKVVDFKQPDGLAQLSTTLKHLTRRIPIAATGLAEIAAAGGQLGIGEMDLPDFVTTVAKMSTAFDMLPAEAGEAMAKLSNIYAIPIQHMTSLGDVINHLSDNSAAKARDMVNTLSRVGGTARQFGLAAHQAAALSNAFIALGKEPEVAGTAINALLQKLQNASGQSKPFIKALDELGYSAHGLEGAIADNAQGALLDFLSTLEKLNKQDRAGILSDLFGLEFSDDISLLVGSLGTYRQALSLVGDKTGYAGSMQREFENRAKTTANNLRLMQNGLTEIAIDLGSIVLPPLNTVINYVRQLTAKFVAFNQEHPMVTKAIMGIAATLIIGKVAAVGFGYAWTFIRGGLLSGIVAINRGRLALMLYNSQLSAHRRLTILSQITGLSRAELMQRRFTRSVVAGNGVVRSLGTTMLGTTNGGIKALLAGLRAITMGLLTTPIGWFISLIVAAGIAIYKYWDQVKAFLSGFMEGLNETLAPVKEAFEPLAPLFNSIADGVGWVVDAIGDLFTPVNATAEELENTANAGRSFGQMLGNAIEIALLPLTTMLKTLKAIHDHMDIVIKSPEKIPGLIWDNAKEKFSAVGNGISYAWDSVFGDEEESLPPSTLKKQKIPPIKTSGTTVNQQNTSHITIVQQPGEDSEALARRVAKEEIKAQERQAQSRRRGLLYDSD